jgi:hypothetical protein
MDSSIHNEIAKRAYAFWEREGRPVGRNLEHWHMAEQELTRPERDAGVNAPTDRANKPPVSDTPTTKPRLATRRGRRVAADSN